MANPKSNTRILVEIGYTKFVLPEGTSADAMAILANAVPVGVSYGRGKHHIHPEHEDKKIDIRIIDAGDIETLLDLRGEDEHQDYDIIFNEVESALKGKDHGSVIFNSNRIEACDKRFEYADMADPEFDPQKLIGEIIEAALKHPSRI